MVRSVRLVGDGDVPHLGAATDVRGRAAADDAFAFSCAAEEVALELDRREALAAVAVEVLTGAGRGERVGETDDRRREEEAGARDERSVTSMCPTTSDGVQRVEHHAEQTRDEAGRRTR